jgi:hypothetical protein
LADVLIMGPWKASGVFLNAKYIIYINFDITKALAAAIEEYINFL